MFEVVELHRFGGLPWKTKIFRVSVSKMHYSNCSRKKVRNFISREKKDFYNKKDRLELSATIVFTVERYDGTNWSVSDSLYKAMCIAKVTTSSEEALTSVADSMF